MAKISLKNVIWKEGNFYVAQCLNVDISSFGESREEAIKNLNEALELYFEDQNEVKISEVSRPQIVTHVKTYD